MDPYQTLGVARNCTHQELKDAFRAKARLAHPDLGGEPAAFIQLREAFDQIGKELERRPPEPVAEKRPRPARPVRRARQPDPNWDPDLIVFDEPLPRTRPGRPRDPNWQPDLILVDEVPGPSRIPPSPAASSSRQNYVRWLRRISARSQPAVSTTPTTDWNASAIMILLIVVTLTVWIFWTGWSHDASSETSETPIKYDPAHGID
jgi:DnaJ domain